MILGRLSDYEFFAERFMAVRTRPSIMERRGIGLSPMLLAQELVTDGFHVLVACCLLNRTGRVQGHRALWEVVRRWETASGLASADPSDLEPVIRGCGFGDRRSKALVRMASEYVSGRRPPSLFACGGYADDAWRMFALLDRSVVPEDRELAPYSEFARKNLSCGHRSVAGSFFCGEAPGHRGGHAYR